MVNSKGIFIQGSIYSVLKPWEPELLRSACGAVAVQMKTVISALLLAAFALAPWKSFGDFDQAVEAYKAGGYETVVKLLRPLAEQGDTDAQ